MGELRDIGRGDEIITTAGRHAIVRDVDYIEGMVRVVYKDGDGEWLNNDSIKAVTRREEDHG